jgi:uncharacterized protein YkwD
MIRLLLAVALLAPALTIALADEEKAKAEEKPKAEAVELGADEKALVELVNKAREKEKLSRLEVNGLLCKVAKQHTQNMARHEKMSHILDGKGVAARVSEAGYDYRKVAENLANAAGDADAPAPPPADIHDHWMKSRAHQANIVEPKYTEVGVSMGRSKKGTYFYTMVFGVRRK